MLILGCKNRTAVSAVKVVPLLSSALSRVGVQLLSRSHASQAEQGKGDVAIQLLIELPGCCSSLDAKVLGAHLVGPVEVLLLLT